LSVILVTSSDPITIYGNYCCTTITLFMELILKLYEVAPAFLGYF